MPPGRSEAAAALGASPLPSRCCPLLLGAASTCYLLLKPPGPLKEQADVTRGLRENSRVRAPPTFCVKREHTARHLFNTMPSRKRVLCWAHPHILMPLCVPCVAAHSCPTPCNPVVCSPPGSSVYRDSPGKNTGVGYHALLLGIFPAQGLNPGLPHCWRILYYLSQCSLF